MKLLLSLIGAQGDAVARALDLVPRLRQRGHGVTVLGSFSPPMQQAFQQAGAEVSLQAQAEAFDAAAAFSLAAPERLGAIARRIPTALLVQDGMLQLMALKGDFVHWVNLFRAAQAVIFLSEHQRDKVFASFTTGVDSSRIAVWAPGADPAAVQPNQPAPKDYFGVVVGGGAAPHRRVQDVVAAGERLRDFNLMFTFLGDAGTPAALPEGTRKVIARHPGRYVFTGDKTPAEALQVIRRADLYCDALTDAVAPQSLLDAAASRLPVMLSDIEPFRRDWVNGVNCLKFPVNRTDFMASLFRMMLQDDVLRNSLAEAARVTALRFPAGRYSAQAVQLLEKLKR